MSKPARLKTNVYSIYDKTHWFTDQEAWSIFRFFAFAEAIGWTLLGSAIVYRHFGWSQYESVIIAAGRIHGLFFTLYFVITLLTARSMGWKLWRILLALAAGCGPYGSLIFEQVIAHLRRIRPIFVEPPTDLD